MKRIGKLVCVLLVLVMILTMTALAAEVRGSGQLLDYEAYIDVSRGSEISIDCTATGNGRMTEIGVSRIVIYEQSGSAWISVDTLSGSSETNTVSYSDVFYFDGEPDTTYQIRVTFVAEDADGHDAKITSEIVTT